MPTHPCRHLDYEEGKHEDCSIETAAPHFPNVRFWRRGERWTAPATAGGPAGPEKVQFCKLRGRINGVFQCYNPGELSCYEALEEAADGRS